MDAHVMPRCMDSTPGRTDEERLSVTALPFMLCLRWQPRIVIDREDITVAGSAIVASGRAGLPLLVEVSALREVTWAARETVLAYEHPARIAILGYDDVDRVLMAFMVRSATKTRFFLDRDAAVRWLLQA
ncbi:hypothetical protein MN0502_14410 [Arthrobacter sp. MN05-02]|nr:hypothetical protein MN0502_14410 [Arthrobacter sp. MN05-02]